MSLTKLNLPPVMDTSSNDLVQDFFGPCLEASTRYDRGVGYFSSGWIRVNSEGLVPFIERGGKVRWITSPILDKKDWAAMKQGHRALADQVVRKALATTVEDLSSALKTDTRVALAWMISEGLVEIKLALPRHDLDGEFHDKFGIFYDNDGAMVSFSGSYNESIQGLRNYESINIFGSWKGEQGAWAQNHTERFARLWANQDANLRVFSIPEATFEQILKLRDNQARPYKAPKERQDPPGYLYTPLGPRIPSDIVPRPYQLEAIEAWKAAGGRGLLEMATGTGKTITAMSLLANLHAAMQRAGTRYLVLIAVPYIHLVEQWREEAHRFGYDPLCCYGSSTSWGSKAEGQLSSVVTGAVDHAMIITTFSTLQGPRMQTLLAESSLTLVVVGDEVHGLGTEGARAMLPDQASFRLGLSATPERHGDEDGTQAIMDYFGEPVFSLGLKQAIDEGFLTPYRYYPVLVHLTDEELEAYDNLSTKIAKAFAMVKQGKGKSRDADEHLTALLMQRARLLASAANKMDALRAEIGPLKDEKNVLVYCGDGRVESSGSQEEKRQIEAVTEMLGHEMGMHVRRYTSTETIDDRMAITNAFKDGDLQAIVAIRCLDEGVDIPQVDKAFILASSQNPRQWVQRRGRVLRTSKSTGKEFASIWDFVVVPDLENLNPASFESERSLMRKELDRVMEFAELSLNKGESLRRLRQLKKAFGLLDA